MTRSAVAVSCVMVVALGLFGLGRAEAQQPSAAEVPPPPPPPPPSAPPPPPPAATPPAPPVAPPGHQYVLMPVEQYKPAPPPRRKRRSPGMMIAGIVTFGVSYIPPAIIGSAVAGLDRDVCDCRDAYRMLIPVVGPLTLLHDPGEYNAFNALLIFDALAQGAGVVLTVFGIMRLSANRDPEVAKLDEPSLDFVALPTPGGARTALQLRF